MSDEPQFMPSLEAVLSDPNINLITCDGSQRIHIQNHAGEVTAIASPYEDDDHLMTEIDIMLRSLGVTIDEDNPIAQLRLSDGTRISVAIPPIAVHGPAIAINKLVVGGLSLDQTIGFGSWTEDMVAFIRACVLAKINMVLAGNASSGMGTILRQISEMIPDEERIIVLEHTAELALALNKPRMVALEARPASQEGQRPITLSDLVVHAVQMYPDRLLASRVRGGEVLHLFELMSTGIEGSMMSMNASSPRDALARLEVMATFDIPTLPLLSVRESMGRAIQLILTMQRMSDGRRKMLKITEVSGLQGDIIRLQDIFEFRQTGYDEEGIQGYHTATGTIPTFVERLRRADPDFSMAWFEPR